MLVAESIIMKFLLCRKIFCVMYCEVEMWPMLYSTLKFKQKMRFFSVNKFVKQRFIM